MLRIAATAFGLAVAFAVPLPSIEAQSLLTGGDVTIPNGEVRQGDTCASAESIRVEGRLGRDANFITDRLDLAPGARIAGELGYRTRTPLSPEEAALVEGAVRHLEPPVDEADESGAAWDAVLCFWQILAALLTGILVVALFRGVVQRLVVSIAEETRLGALLGLATLLVVPVAAAIAIVTLAGLLMGIAGVLLFGLAPVRDKLPVAIRLGDCLLSYAGRPGALPYAAMVALGSPRLQRLSFLWALAFAA